MKNGNILLENVLLYWQDALRSSDITGLQGAFPRITVKAPSWLSRNDCSIATEENQDALQALFVDEVQGETTDAEITKNVPSQKTSALKSDNEVSEIDAFEQKSDNLEQDKTNSEIPEEILVAICLCKKDHSSRKTCIERKEILNELKLRGWSHNKLNTNLEIVFYVPAILNNQGKLQSPHQRTVPAFVRGYLEPQPESCTLECYGQYEVYREALQAFINHLPYESWEQYWTVVTNLFLKVSSVWNFFKDDPQSKFQFVVVKSQAGFATQHLVRAYEEISWQNPPPLLRRLIGLEGSTSRHPLDELQLLKIRSEHLAMVNRREGDSRTIFPLDPTQRLALSRLLQLNGEPGIIAVNGPPGTGKTDMLRAMISNFWVQATRDGSPCPIIIACGATNQSVENIMKAFGTAADPFEELNVKSRWLKGVYDYSFSAPAISKFKEHIQRFQAIGIKDSKEPLSYVGLAKNLDYLTASSLRELTAGFGARFFFVFADLDSYLNNCKEPVDDKKPIKKRDHPIARRLPKLTEELKEVFRGDFLSALGSLSLAELEKGLLSLLHPRPSRRNDQGTNPEEEALNCTKLFVQKISNFLQEELYNNLDAIAALKIRLVELYERSPKTPDALGDELDSLFSRFQESDGFKIARKAIEKAFLAANRMEYLESLERVLDVTLRTNSFHIAARYWEAQWLQSNLCQNSEELDREEELRRFSMLGPCIVSTLHSAPKLLCGGNGYLFGKVDLLIVDEAGQASPDLGGAVLAFAKQAVVVGDLKQLAPVTQLSESEDLQIIADHNLNLATMNARGMTVAKGSIMQMAGFASSFNDPGKQGILLRRHYRCVESIISFCIELLYGDELESTKADLKLVSLDNLKTPSQQLLGCFPLPPMAFVQCGGPNDEPQKLESWSNRGEARKIVDWLKTDGLKLVAWVAHSEGKATSEKDLADLVAIVTPFRGQANLIRDLVAEHMDNSECKFSQRMTIGTVHTLQGAEKPVILFSAVNKQPSEGQDVFIDRDGGNLLNVAVSRAKNAFILFGHSELFFSPAALDPSNRRPTAILGKYMAGFYAEKYQGAAGIKLFPQVLTIVESPLKAAAFDRYLPKEFEAFGSQGHIRNLKAGNIQAETAFKPEWVVSKESIARIERIGTRLLQTRHLILATDPDPQGEAIAWHLLQVLKQHPNFRYVCTVSRVVFTSVTREAIQAAFSQPQKTVEITGQSGRLPEDALDLGQVYAALGQRIIDNFLGGYFFKKYQIGAGRIKAPLLRLLAGSLERTAQSHAVLLEGSNAFAVEVYLRVTPKNGRDETKYFLPCRLVELGRDRCGELKRFRYMKGGDSRNSAEEIWRSIDGREVVYNKNIALPSFEVTIPCPTALSTVDVLRHAFRRFRFDPGKTTEILASLYTNRSEQDNHPKRETEYEDDWEWDELVNEDFKVCQSGSLTEEGTNEMKRLPYVELKQGRLEVTVAGRQAAARLAQQEPYLSNFAFSRELETTLDEVAAGKLSYEEFVDKWARRILCTDQAFKVAPPDGSQKPELDYKGYPIHRNLAYETLWNVEYRALDELSHLIQEILPDSDLHSGTFLGRHEPKNGEGKPVSYGKVNAHPPLAPLSLDCGADAETVKRLLTPEERCVYAILWCQTLACVMKTPRLHVTPYFFYIQGFPPNCGLRIDVAEAIEEGWFIADPDGRRAELNRWGSPDIVRRLIAGEFRGIVKTIGQPRRADCLSPTVDHILTVMEEEGIGRPSTYATHLTGLMGNQSRVAEPKGETRG